MATPIPFGAWAPDQPDLDSSALLVRNVLPHERSYRPFPQLTQFSTSLSARAIGAIAVRARSGTVFEYVGESANIRQLVGNSWSAVTSLSGSYTTADSDFWEFVQWGDTVIGVNGLADQPQQISLGAANFAGLPGGAPKAKHICVNRDFVVLGHVSDSALGVTRVRWCAINNPTSWTVDAATLADFQDLDTGGGHIERLVGGVDYGLVFQRQAITRMAFVGSPIVFRFDPVQTNIGLYVTQALCAHQNLVFFLAEDGFYAYDGTGVPKPIGRGRVDRYFFDNLDAGYIARIVAAADPNNKVAVWAFPAVGSGGMLTRLLIYSWSYDKWTEVHGISVDYMWRALTTGVTLDGLDAFFASLDDVTPDLDDPFWQGGNGVLAAVSGRRLHHFNGAPMAATLDTGEFQLNPAGLSYITNMWPIMEGQSAPLQAALATRNRLNESATFSTAVTPISSGDLCVRSTARYHRVRMTLDASANWQHATGFVVSAGPAGVR